MTTGASFKRGASKQDYQTPQDFRDAVIKRFGFPLFDLAASAENSFGTAYYCEEENSLSKDWRRINGLLWLNPPFDNIAPWANKCWDESRLGAHILLLVPASVGSNWFRDYVFSKAHVYFLNGRICFDGKSPYPKDCLLAEFHEGKEPGFEIWKWK